MSNAISPLIVLGLPAGALGYAHPSVNATTAVTTIAATANSAAVGAGATWRVSKPEFKANSAAPAMAFDHAHVAKQARGSQPPRGTPR